MTLVNAPFMLMPGAAALASYSTAASVVVPGVCYHRDPKNDAFVRDPEMRAADADRGFSGGRRFENDPRLGNVDSLSAKISSSDRKVVSSSIADILLKARSLFIEHGKGDACVSLREVKRIKSYITTFEPTQGLPRAAINALWLMLGTGLTKDERKGELGQSLRRLIGTLKVPGESAEDIQKILKQVIEPVQVHFDDHKPMLDHIFAQVSSGTMLEGLLRDQQLVLLASADPSLALSYAFELFGSGNMDLQIPAARAFPQLSTIFAKDPQALQLIRSSVLSCIDSGRRALLLEGLRTCRVFLELSHHDSSDVDDLVRVVLQTARGGGVVMDEDFVIGSFVQTLAVAASIPCLDSDLRTRVRERILHFSGSSHWTVRQETAKALGKALHGVEVDGEFLEQALGRLGELSKDESSRVRNESIKAIALVAEHLKSDSPLVMDLESRLFALIGPRGSLSDGIAMSLSAVVSTALRVDEQRRSGFLERILERSRTDDNAMRSISAQALAGMWAAYSDDAEKDDRIVDRLLELLGTEVDAVREGVTMILGHLFSSGGNGKKSQSRVVKALLDVARGARGWLLRRHAIASLGQLVPSHCDDGRMFPEVVDCVFDLTHADNASIQRVAIASLAQLFHHLESDDERRQRIGLRLIDLMQHRDGVVREEAVKAFESIAPELGISPSLGEVLIERLVNMRKGEDELLEEPAIRAIVNISGGSDVVRSNMQERLSGVLAGFRELTSISSDSAVRISDERGNEVDLDANVSVLASKLHAHDAIIRADARLALDRDFDHTLATAHTLLNRLTQALAINRFVLLSGPPASGKSEVGRYLAGQLFWETQVFNCHRYISEEDLLQRIGVVANGATRFTITDGPLARALTEGHLFIANEINLVKPGSLAFLFKVLADVDTTFDYYNAATGEVEQRPIHPNFRFVATQNPDGPGRKDLNAALKNRAVEIAAEAYSSLELEALIRTRAPNLDRSHPDIVSSLVALHTDIGRGMAARMIGGHAEGYVWNLRHLMRMADAFAAHEGELSARDVLRLAYDSVGVSLRPVDRSGFFELVRNQVYGGVTVREEDVEAFVDEKDRLDFATVFTENGIDPELGAQAVYEAGLTEMSTTARFLHAALISLCAGQHPWFKGPAGTGKTQTVVVAAQLLGAMLFSDKLTPQTDESKLKGDLKPTTRHGRLGFQHVPAALVNALRASHRTDRMVVCVLDEAGFARPDVLEELNTALDRDGGIWVQREDGEGVEFLKRPENFRLALASNTYGGYSGVSLQSDAFRSRMHEIYMDFEYEIDEIANMLGL